MTIEDRIKALEADLDYQIEQNASNQKMMAAIKEIQDILIKMDSQIWFVNKL
jgi:hypothetical protein